MQSNVVLLHMEETIKKYSMENKLQELTNKLYEEGLAKGRSDAEKLVADAEEKAKKIVREAEERAAALVEDARKKSEELRKNTMTEIALAGRQAVSALKGSISEMIVAKTVSGSVHDAAVDPHFIKDMLLAVASNWNGDSEGRVTLSALLPAKWQERFEKEFDQAARELLARGVEVGYSDSVRSGFKIGEKGGGYYISFSDADFDALLSEFLKEKVSRILYEN